MSLKELLKGIDPNNVNSIKDVLAIATRYSIQAADEEADADEAQILNSALIATLSYAQDLLEKLSDYKDYVENLGHANLGDINGALDLAITSFSSVVNAESMYSIQWFANLLIPEEDKQTLAQTLMSNCGRYTKSYQDLYKSIIDGDPGIMEKIRYPQSKE